MLWWWDFFSDVADPYVVVLNATPKIALGPIFIVSAGSHDDCGHCTRGCRYSLFVTVRQRLGAPSSKCGSRKTGRGRGIRRIEVAESEKVVFLSSGSDDHCDAKVNSASLSSGRLSASSLPQRWSRLPDHLRPEHLQHVLVMTSLVILTVIRRHHVLCGFLP